MVKTLEQLWKEQSHTIDRLNRIITNTKKIGRGNYTVTKIEGRKTDLQNLWTKCQELDVEMNTVATDEQMKKDEYFKSKIFQQAEDIYYQASDYLNEIMEELQPRQRPRMSVDASALDASMAGAAAQFAPRLTRINPPKFSGKRAEWENFRDLFTSLVINNPSLTNVERMHFLKTSITGEAEFLLRNIKISEANFTEAWKQLTEEFENKQLLINTHLQAIFDIPVMKTESANALRSLRDTVNSSLAALNNLDRPTNHWDDMLIYVLTTKLAWRTRQEWRMKSTEIDNIPNFKEFITFISKRIRGLEDNRPSENTSSNQARDSRSAKVHSTDARENNNYNNNFNCPICSGNHLIFKCIKLLQADIENRYNLLKRAKCCTKCLKVGHKSFECRGKIKCFKCDKAHHTILHRESNYKKGNNNSPNPAPSKPRVHEGSTARDEAASSSSDNDDIFPKNSSSVVHTVRQVNARTTVLLPTALVALRTAEGRRVITRALIDQCSTYSFISDSLSQGLKTRRYKTVLSINTFGEQYNGTSNSKLQLLVESINGKYSFPFDAYVYRRISAYAASKPRVLSRWPYLEGLELADPTTNHKQPINLLIGSDLFGAIILDGLRKGPLGSPIAQLTIFGWILSGPVSIENNEENNTVATVHTVSPDPLNIENLITRFWETEEISSKRHLTNDEEECENHFRETHTRNADGRYIVRLPFKQTPPPMGNSINIAARQYLRLEKRLERNSELSEKYHAFLAEYRDLGHMEIVPIDQGQISERYYLPHHPVIRESSSTTKLRVVFNASCRTTNGTSLNDHLLIGPKLQNELPAIIIRWRLHKYVLTADINKMFRQILVHPEDCNYQRILWRVPGNNKVQIHRLLTVTYGTASAPYLAIRVLQQLAEDESENYPLAKSILLNDIYVDDVLFGANSSNEILQIKDELDKLLNAGGFHLRKWASNNKKLLEGIPHGDHELAIDHPLQEDDNIKILGISWAPLSDSFFFKVSPMENPGDTKRQVLSTIARLFDPLGWATPVVVTAKILMQEIWLRKSQWDEKLPTDILDKWQNYCHCLPLLSEIRIPRWFNYSTFSTSYQLHGFSDASERAYAAAVYLRVETSDKGTIVNLIAAKSKVAPLKSLSIPRLELCAAVLLVRLMKFVADTINLSQVSMICWTDSTVVLDWLKKPPSTWKTFIANRVSEIQTKLTDSYWYHVPSSSNPADCASRGISTAELLNHKQWWSGPRWLRESKALWPIQYSNKGEIDPNHNSLVNAEIKKATVHTVYTPREIDNINKLPDRVSTWPKLLRVTAYLFRAVANFKAKVAKEPLNNSGLTAEEVDEARLFWVKRVQNEFFASEIEILKEASKEEAPNGKMIKFPHKSPLICLSPFLEDELIRLGGRLKHAPLPYDEKYPIILPKCRVAQLIIDDAHDRALHAGPQLTLRTIRQNFWILGARRLVRTQINSCVICARERGTTAIQKMGNLPKGRVTPSRCFSHTGVDYAGPFHVLAFTGRGQKSRKAYIAVFVCLSSRAIHLELVTDYSTLAFLAAFKRFVSRRGIPKDMYSDNGTNFRGADRELTEEFQRLQDDPELSSVLATDGTTWHFIPSAAPHFGGIWEAGVKSVKHHLRRIVGDHTLSIEEFSTLLCQIEACLNSRPIHAMTSDPNDFAVLTPGHLLTGAPLTTIPEESVLNINVNRLSRYQHVRAMYEHFWRAWSQDYLHSLQMRNKWQQKQPDIKENDIVLLKNNLLPPCKWELARVVKTFPGEDNLIRVVEVKTAKSKYKRPITQICPLPIITE